MRSREQLGLAGMFHRWNISRHAGNVVGRCRPGGSRSAGGCNAGVGIWLVPSPAAKGAGRAGGECVALASKADLVSRVWLASFGDVALLVAAVKPGGAAEKIMHGMWQAYGPALKVVGVIALIFFVGMPVLAFIRKVLR